MFTLTIHQGPNSRYIRHCQTIEQCNTEIDTFIKVSKAFETITNIDQLKYITLITIEPKQK